MAKREFLMLAHKYEPKKHFINGWYVSEKLDGIRAFWDGGISRGLPSRNIPWANVEKDGRLLNEQIATGLWSRYGKVIHAPDWWLDSLPDLPLDGELYGDDWQHTSKIVKRLDKEGNWNEIKYFAFDSPSLDVVFADGMIDNINYKKEFNGILNWIVGKGKYFRPKEVEHILDYIKIKFPNNEVFQVLDQNRLSFSSEKAEKELNIYFNDVLDKGGEGIMLRCPWSIWTPERSKNILKMKGVNDAEGIVTGFIGGKGKLAGLFGALILDFNGKRLELSGFTDEERKLKCNNEEISLSEELEGKELDLSYSGIYFNRGDTVTFRYRELTNGGLPKEARYLRKRVD